MRFYGIPRDNFFNEIRLGGVLTLKTPLVTALTSSDIVVSSTKLLRRQIIAWMRHKLAKTELYWPQNNIRISEFKVATVFMNIFIHQEEPVATQKQT